MLIEVLSNRKFHLISNSLEGGGIDLKAWVYMGYCRKAKGDESVVY